MFTNLGFVSGTSSRISSWRGRSSFVLVIDGKDKRTYDNIDALANEGPCLFFRIVPMSIQERGDQVEDVCGGMEEDHFAMGDEEEMEELARDLGLSETQGDSAIWECLFSGSLDFLIVYVPTSACRVLIR